MKRLLAAMILVATHANAQSIPRINAAAVDQVVRHELTKGFSGVVLVAVGDSVMLRNAYGSVTSPAQPFRVASIARSLGDTSGANGMPLTADDLLRRVRANGTAGDFTTGVVHSASGDKGHAAYLAELPRDVTVIVLSNAGWVGGKTWASRVGTNIGDFLKQYALAPERFASTPQRAPQRASHSLAVLVLIFIGSLVIFSIPAIGAGFVARSQAAKSRDEWKLLAWLHVLPLAIWAPKIAFDTTRDPTSHNLWPFELAFWLFLSLVILAAFLVGRRLFGGPPSTIGRVTTVAEPAGSRKS